MCTQVHERHPRLRQRWNLPESETKTKDRIYAAYADNDFLPLALLLAKTFRPPLVAILFLKPCSLLLCLFFGWNVLFAISLHLLVRF